jgi:type I restriction enzyme S subunit
MEVEVERDTIKKVPKLRFTGFAGEWPIVPMERIADIERGRFSPRPRNDPRFYGGAIPFVQTNDVVNCDGVIEQYSQTLNEEGLAVSKLFPAGSILMTIAANIGHTGVLQVDMACPDSLVGIKCKPDYHNYFLNHFLSTQQSTLEYLAPEGAQKNINLEVLRPFQVPKPTLPEQQKIAAFLGAVDRKIQQLKRKQALLEQYKKGVVQQLFSQELRFKREDGGEFPEWEEKRLGDVVTFYRGGALSKSDLNPEGKTACIHYGELFTTYNAVIDSVVSRTNVSDGFMSREGDVLMPSSDVTPEGLATASALMEKQVLLGGDINVLRPNANVNSVFLSYLLNSEKKKLLVLVSGTTVKHIYNKHLADLEITIPSDLEEQARIAGFLMALDAKVAGVAQAVAAAQKWKKGLLQQMFV